MADDVLVSHGKFPEGFLWGAATENYMIEGAYNAEGKGMSTWDAMVRSHPHLFGDCNGDIAADSYHKFRKDIEALKELKVNHYKFSLSWSRILPTGNVKEPNFLGIAYYNSLIDELLAAGIQPMVTLYSWDMPIALAEGGGWLENSTIEAFVKYAELCFHFFGDRVKLWITIFEPFVVGLHCYEDGLLYPGETSESGKMYLSIHNLIKAHARVYRKYREDYYAKQKGQVGISLEVKWSLMANADSSDDQEAMKRNEEFNFGWVGDPIFKTGDYPDVVKQRVAENSYKAGLGASRLPEFTKEEMSIIKGSSDFYGITYWTAEIISASQPEGQTKLSLMADKGVNSRFDPNWESCASHWLKIVPGGLRPTLNKIKERFGNIPIYVTANGISDNGIIQDEQRIRYIRDNVSDILKAIRLDGIDVRGYCYWSLIDGFYWNGYKERFGLFHVDFDSQEKERNAKASVAYYKKIIQNNAIDSSLEL